MGELGIDGYGNRSDQVRKGEWRERVQEEITGIGRHLGSSRLPVMGQSHHHSCKAFNLHPVLPARCAGAMMAQSLGEEPTNDWRKPMPDTSG